MSGYDVAKRFDHSRSFRVQPESMHCATLDTWNDYRREYWEAVRDRLDNPQNYLNGLLCPRCGGRLYDTGVITCVAPKKVRVKCQDCKHKDERYE
jgi:hypothetical protein